MSSRDEFEQNMADELRFHIEQVAEDLMRSGIPREEALRQARMECGGLNTIQEECRQARGVALVR